MIRLRCRRDRAVPPIESVAAVAQRLAVLLSAGVSPHSAWGYLESEPPASALPATTRPGPTRVGPSVAASTAIAASTARIVAAADTAGSRGESVSAAIAFEARQLGGQIGDAWLALAGAWEVAIQSGAPLASCLRQLASTFREVGQLHRTLDVALTGPTATAQMMMALPTVGILFGTLMGFDAVHTLFFTVPGLICLFGGAALMVLGHLWNGRLMHTARARDPAPGLELDLMAIAMTGGGSLERARALVQTTLTDFDLPGGGGDGGARSVLDRVLELSSRAGVPAAELLRSEADELRRDARSAGERRAESLAVTLMMPLGLCVLPAFMLVAVVPLLLSVLSSTLHTL